jgi:hypothetical protein
MMIDLIHLLQVYLLKIEEVIAFTKWLSDKQISVKRAKSGIWVT